jgi:hypothetical protein
VSAYLPDLAREVTRQSGDWLPGSMALVVLGIVLVAAVLREMFRTGRAADSEPRIRAAAVVFLPLVLCAAIAMGARFAALAT